MLGDGTFAYSGIADRIDSKLAGTTMTIVSLIDSTGEHPMLKAELSSLGLPDLWGPSYWPPYLQPDYDAEELHPCVIRTSSSSRTANFMWWPIEGVGQGQDPHVFLTSPGWDLCGLVDRITELLHDPARAIYVHCSLGADRTGAVVACYMIRAHGMNVNEAISFTSSQTPAGAPNRDYLTLIQAYAAKMGRV